MSKKEHIRLDAHLQSVIGTASFRAKLANGHEIVAYADRADRTAMDGAYGPGDRVTVEMSPFDMSKGRILLDPI